MPWAVRFKFRIGKKVASDEPELIVRLDGVDAVMKPSGSASFRDTPAVAMIVRGLESEEVAREVGARLKRAVLVAGISATMGIDPGEDRASGAFGQMIKDAVKASSGAEALNDVHGVYVYPSEGNEVFLSMSAKATVMAKADRFIESIEAEYVNAARVVADRSLAALELIGLAQIGLEPLAQATLAISAVEMLAQSPPWSHAQEIAIRAARDRVVHDEQLTSVEAEEVAGAMERLFRTSIRQSVKRKIFELGFDSPDWKEFDELYSLRSAIFHGSLTGRDTHRKLAAKAIAVCGKIVLEAVRGE